MSLDGGNLEDFDNLGSSLEHSEIVAGYMNKPFENPIFKREIRVSNLEKKRAFGKQVSRS